jgi:hypothetical protein
MQEWAFLCNGSQMGKARSFPLDVEIQPQILPLKVKMRDQDEASHSCKDKETYT